MTEAENPKIQVDTDWKEEAQAEKEELGRQHEAGARQPLPPATFTTHCASLAMQAMIFMGVVRNPATGETEKDLEHARYIIDTIAILVDKTQGNLTAEEKTSTGQLLGELRMEWVRASGAEESSEEKA